MSNELTQIIVEGEPTFNVDKLPKKYQSLISSLQFNYNGVGAEEISNTCYLRSGYSYECWEEADFFDFKTRAELIEKLNNVTKWDNGDAKVYDLLTENKVPKKYQSFLADLLGDYSVQKIINTKKSYIILGYSDKYSSKGMQYHAVALIDKRYTRDVYTSKETNANDLIKEYIQMDKMF